MPNKGHLNVGIQATHGRTSFRAFFQRSHVRRIRRQRHMQLHRDTCDSTRVGTHLLSHLNPHALQIQLVFSGVYSHNCSHARSRGRTHQICWRERSTLSVIIQWRVRTHASARTLMLQLAVQLSFVLYFTSNHRVIMLRFSPSPVKLRLLIFCA